MADSKELLTFRITFCPDLFRETKQKQKKITSKQQSLMYSFPVCLHFIFYGKIFFPFLPWFLNATILCGTLLKVEPQFKLTISENTITYHNALSLS